MRRFIPALAVLALGACLDTSSPKEEPTNPATESFAVSTGVNISEMTKTTNGVYYKVTTPNPAGTTLTTKGLVTIDYTGYLKNGVTFDQQTGAQFDLNGVIVGFAEGMLGMHVGETRKIVVPSALGYGANTVGFIPANSTLVFDVSLRSIP